MRVLLIPESFPTDLDPVAGVFMQDQIKALSPFCELNVFNTNPWYRGVYSQSSQAVFFDFHVFSRKWSFPFNLIAYWWWERGSLALAKKIPKPDIIHLHGSSLRGKIARELAAYWKIPYVITEHTGPWSAVASRPAIFERAKSAIASAEVLLPVSHHLAREIRDSGIAAKKVEVLGNPIDDQLFDLRKEPFTAQKRILFIGRLDPFKGGLRTLRAFLAVADSIPEFRLHIAGEGLEADTMQDVIAGSGIAHRIEFEHRVLSRTEMRDLFHASSFLVFPSGFESFGLVGAEALATGLPAILPNRTGPRDYFFPEGCIQVNPDNETEIAAAMVEMVNRITAFSPAEIRKRLVDEFGLSAYGKNMVGVYSSLISAKFVG